MLNTMDFTGLRAGSVDVVVVDLPFGLQHKRMDVRALLQMLAVVLRCPGSRALSLSLSPPHQPLISKRVFRFLIDCL